MSKSKLSIIVKGLEIFPKDDGVTHINIFTGGKTELGRLLTNFTCTELRLFYGKFSSLEGYYHYLKAIRAISENDFKITHDVSERLNSLKTLTGIDAQSAGRELRTFLIRNGLFINDVPDEWFNVHFRLALVIKIKSNPRVVELLQSNELPFVHYYTFGAINKADSKVRIVHKEHFNWLPDIISDVSAELETKGELCVCL